MVQPIKPQLAMLASHMSASLSCGYSTSYPVNASGKVVEDGPGTWSPTTPSRVPNTCFWPGVRATGGHWVVRVTRGHLSSESAGGRFFPFCLSFLCNSS